MVCHRVCLFYISMTSPPQLLCSLFYVMTAPVFLFTSTSLISGPCSSSIVTRKRTKHPYIGTHLSVPWVVLNSLTIHQPSSSLFLATIIQRTPHITSHSLTTWEPLHLSSTHGALFEERIGFLTGKAGAARAMMWCGEFSWFGWREEGWWCLMVGGAV